MCCFHGDECDCLEKTPLTNLFPQENPNSFFHKRPPFLSHFHLRFQPHYTGRPASKQGTPSISHKVWEIEGAFPSSFLFEAPFGPIDVKNPGGNIIPARAFQSITKILEIMQLPTPTSDKIRSRKPMHYFLECLSEFHFEAEPLFY